MLRAHTSQYDPSVVKYKNLKCPQCRFPWLHGLERSMRRLGETGDEMQTMRQYMYDDTDESDEDEGEGEESDD